jgi:hypothetical protein
MAQSGFTPISIYYSTTASAVPTAANLVPGELAINTNDGKLYYEDSSGVVRVLASKSTGSIGGSNTQVQFNNSGSLGGSSGLTWDGSFLTTSSIKNSALTSGRVTYAGASGLLSDSANLVWDNANTRVGIGTSSPQALIETSSATDSSVLINATTATQSNRAALLMAARNANGNSGNVSIEGISVNNQQNDMVFRTGASTLTGFGTERMRINTAGVVSIGTTTAVAPLNVMGQTTSTSTPILYLQQGGSFPGYGYTFAIDNVTTGNLLLRRYGSNTNTDLGSILTITDAGVVTMPAYGAGAATFSAAGVISSVSDETWKTKDGVPTNTDAMLQKLKPGYWFYNKEKAPIFGQDRQLGFYAQNIHEAIGEEAAPTPEEGKPWGYYDRSVLAVVVMSLKNALSTIEELKQRITVLENK